MAIKYFIFGLVLFVCTRSNGEEYDQEIKSTSSGVFNGDKLHQTIEDSGSESFFQESLKEIGEDDAIGQTKCAIFDLFSSIVNPRLLSPVFDQQVRDFIFSFGYEQIESVFKTYRNGDPLNPPYEVKQEFKTYAHLWHQ
ncbi:hypothetical protein ABG067_007865, partial [Albugo candida]